MARYYQRPENALKKATEFIEVGKPSRALDTLYDVIKGKKHRSFSEKVIEPIMLKYLELCVELKKPHTAKEGLYQYRLMCQSVNVGLLEKVIRNYIRMAEDKTEAAKAAIEKKDDAVEKTAEGGEEQPIIVEVDDLDNLSMADMTLLNVITEEQAQERSGRAALIPWVKFLWESYTQCLDLLRNNPRLENLYHDIAQMAFKFCLAYSRKTEFRKLCERLRKHFDDIINRQGSQMNSIDFSSPETQQLNMETRLSQLDSAITLELWQEAYKAIEDIHLLMNQSKKSQTRMMAYYYQKLSLVFWKAGNHLFHAATLMKYYLLCKDMKKNVSAEELQKNASQVVLSTLAIPFPVLHPEFERFVETDKGMLEKSQKLATLLFLPQPPTRMSMMRDIGRHGILSNSIKPLQDLHDVLESEFCPLSLCEDVNKLLDTAASSEFQTDYMEQYIDPLREVTLVRLIKQVSQVYQTIDYDHLLTMTVFSNQTQLEQILVDAVRYNDMQISIDHCSNCIKFGSSLAEASREDLPEGPHLQIMPSETVRLQLVNVMNCLQEAVDMINPVSASSEEDMIRSKIINQHRMTEVQYHRSLMDRQKIINVRREELERSQIDRDYEEKMRVEQIMKQQVMVEAKRLEAEREERERKKQEAEQTEMKTRRVEEKLRQIGQTMMGQKIIQKFSGEDTTKLDLDTVLQRQQEELQKEAKEHLARMKSQEKRFDHVERAKRIEEIAVIEEYMETKKEEEKVEWEAHESERISHLIEERKVAVANRDRMKRMREDKDSFLQSLLDARRDTFTEKLDEFNRDFTNVKSMRLAERKAMRKEERRRKYEEEKAAAERARLDAIRKAKEEEERIEREKTQKELEEKNRITFEKQLAKQREIEEREQKDREERIKSGDTTSPESTSPQTTEVWRAKSIGQKPSTPALNNIPGGPPTPTAAAASPAAAPANPSAWKPRSLQQKKAGDLGGELPPQDLPPRERPDRERQDRERGDRDRGDRDRGDRERGGDRGEWERVERRGDRDRGDRDRGDRDRGERDRGAEPDFDRSQMRDRSKMNDKEERPFERRMERGPAGEGDSSERDGRRGDWGRNDRDRGGAFERPKGRERDSGAFERPRGSGGRSSDLVRSQQPPEDNSWRKDGSQSARDRPGGEERPRGDRDSRGGGRGGRDGGPSFRERGGDREGRGGEAGPEPDNWRRGPKKEEGAKPRSKP